MIEKFTPINKGLSHTWVSEVDNEKALNILIDFKELEASEEVKAIPVRAFDLVKQLENHVIIYCFMSAIVTLYRKS